MEVVRLVVVVVVVVLAVCVCVSALGFPPSTYLDVHLGPLQEAQGGVSAAVRAQRNQLLQLLQVEPQLGASVDDKHTREQELRTWGGHSRRTGAWT